MFGKFLLSKLIDSHTEHEESLRVIISAQQEEIKDLRNTILSLLKINKVELGNKSEAPIPALNWPRAKKLFEKGSAQKENPEAEKVEAYWRKKNAEMEHLLVKTQKEQNASEVSETVRSNGRGSEREIEDKGLDS